MQHNSMINKTRARTTTNTTQTNITTSIGNCIPEFIKKMPPIFRGMIHVISFYTVTSMLVIMSIIHFFKKKPIYLPALIYLLSQMVLFGVSGFYHRYNFYDGIVYKQKIFRNIIKSEKHNEGAKLFLQKLDHACIYILIAGTQTSTLLSLYYNKSIIPPNVIKFMYLTWIYAACGLIKVFLCDRISFLNLNNDIGNTMIYIIHGFFVLPFIKYFYREMNLLGIICLIFGAFFYSLGGILFAFEIPHMSNSKFGFHEFWHLQTVLANGCMGLPIFLKYRQWWMYSEK